MICSISHGSESFRPHTDILHILRPQELRFMFSCKQNNGHAWGLSVEGPSRCKRKRGARRFRLRVTQPRAIRLTMGLGACKPACSICSFPALLSSIRSSIGSSWMWLSVNARMCVAIDILIIQRLLWGVRLSVCMYATLLAPFLCWLCLRFPYFKWLCLCFFNGLRVMF